MKNKLMTKVESSQSKPNLPEISIGDTVEVHVRIREGNKERIQLYEGLVISTRGQGTGKTIRVRKISYGIGVERVFLVHSPIVSDIKVLKSNKVRRAKLYYMRKLHGKASRLKEKKKQL